MHEQQVAKSKNQSMGKHFDWVTIIFVSAITSSRGFTYPQA